MHLATNAPVDATVYSLDIATGPLAFDGDAAVFGSRVVGEYAVNGRAQARVQLVTADTVQFDFAPFTGTADLVFIDADHTFEAVVQDSEIAFRLLRPGGVVLWHDYLMTEGVTSAMRSLSRPGLIHIEGTTLVALRI